MANLHIGNTWTWVSRVHWKKEGNKTVSMGNHFGKEEQSKSKIIFRLMYFLQHMVV